MVGGERLKRGTPGHPKLERLADLLSVRKREAVGMIELLHHFTDEYAPRGDVGKFTDAQIARRVDWDGDPSRLISALIESGLVDLHPVHRLVIHDWHDHAPEYTKRKATKVTNGADPTGWAVDDEPSGLIQKNPDISGLPCHAMPSQSMPGQDGSGPETSEPQRAAPAKTPTQEPEPQAPAPRARTKRKPVAELTLAPDRLPDADRPRLEAWLEKRGWEWFASELPREVETCLAHFRANGGSKADWYATAQTWITRAINGGGGFQPMPAERREEIAKRSRSIQAGRRIAAEIAAKPTPIRDPPEAEPEEIVFRSVTVGGG